ncbi:MAG: histidine kinase [Ignavibacteria bacterium]|nr:histidine kinase [Ignavibacteria bacterium]MBI3766436.1 histidine kinase [Ignavibacteriales bacterium]
MRSQRTHNTYSPIISEPWGRWVTILVSWTVFGLFMAWQIHYQTARAGNPITWGNALLSEMTYAFLWAALTPLILRLAWKFPLDTPPWIINGSFHLLTSIGIAIAHKASYHAVVMFVESTPENPFSLERLFRAMWTYLDYGILLYWMLVLLQHAYEYFRRNREIELEKSRLEAQLALAQLSAIKMQLHPHFLFNTLNAISVLIQKDPIAARTMIIRLAELLRFTLENAGTQEVQLKQELDFLDRYLQIERTRFEDRLTLRQEIDPETLNAYVPSLILQPIVENAMRHGVSKQRGAAVLEIRSSKLNGVLQLQVQDNGPGFDEFNGIDEGIGLSNTRARLQQLYGAEQNFDLRNCEHGGVIATITIPFHTSVKLTVQSQ